MVPPQRCGCFDATTLAQLIAGRLQRECNAASEDLAHQLTQRHLEDVMAIDEARLNEFLGRFVTDLGATVAAGNVVIGHRLGLYRALADNPGTADELARRVNCNPRYVAEWLRGQAAGGYVEYDASRDAYWMTEEQAFALADPEAGVYAPGAFVLALGALSANDRITEAFRTGDGMGWHEHDENVFVGCEQFFRPGYVANLVPAWIPALDGVEQKLRSGARVADIGCGLGASTILLAREYAASTFVGSDYHDRSIELARKRAAEAGVSERATFEVSSAASFTGSSYDLVTTFDCLHDMGDPVAAAKHVRSALAHDGTWLVVEPAAGDHVTDNLNPVGRVYYNFSTQLCVPSALSQSGGWALGAQAGEAAMRRVMTEAGFTRFRRAAETPFNIVYEVRP
jgi:2-polyprenyl-3-methyl-5-hydroxy-6-metoxy-1,4-benzoquinol methylase